MDLIASRPIHTHTYTQASAPAARSSRWSVIIPPAVADDARPQQTTPTSTNTSTSAGSSGSNGRPRLWLGRRRGEGREADGAPFPWCLGAVDNHYHSGHDAVRLLWGCSVCACRAVGWTDAFVCMRCGHGMRIRFLVSVYTPTHVYIYTYVHTHRHHAKYNGASDWARDRER